MQAILIRLIALIAGYVLNEAMPLNDQVMEDFRLRRFSLEEGRKRMRDVRRISPFCIGATAVSTLLLLLPAPAALLLGNDVLERVFRPNGIAVYLFVGYLLLTTIMTILCFIATINCRHCLADPYYAER